MAREGVVIQGLDLMDIIKFTSKKNKKFQAIFLAELEEILSPDSEEFLRVRKLYLDAQNDYTRSIIRTIFGEIEHTIE